VVPKLVRDVTPIKLAIMSSYPQYFAVITHNTEHHCVFESALCHEESHITPGVIYPQFGYHCFRGYLHYCWVLILKIIIFILCLVHLCYMKIACSVIFNFVSYNGFYH